MQEVVVIDYGMGNLHSVQKALSFLGAQPKLSQDAEEIQTAQKLILDVYKRQTHRLPEYGARSTGCIDRRNPAQ